MHPCTVYVNPVPKHSRIVYSDASIELDTLPRLECVCIDERGHTVLALTLGLDQDTQSTWLPLKTQICAAEAFCFPAAVLDRLEFFAGQDIGLQKMKHL